MLPLIYNDDVDDDIEDGKGKRAEEGRGGGGEKIELFLMTWNENIRFCRLCRLQLCVLKRWHFCGGTSAQLTWKPSNGINFDRLFDFSGICFVFM